jgi:adenosylcobinamide-GDP ribazoletransferase
VIGALAFLTIAGRARPPRTRDLVWFPVVGALLGAVLGLIWWGAENIWPSAVAAALVVAADLALTGLLHVDGLADSADGLLPHLDRDRRLAVMSAPDVGAFAVAAVAATLLLRWSALAAQPVDGWRSVVVLAAIWSASRAAMVLVLTTQPYARAGEGGLASRFLDDRPGGGRLPAAVAATAVVVAVVAGAVGDTWGPACLLTGLGAGLLVVLLARRRIGGYTGDVLGALGMVIETVALVALAADP